MTLLVGILCTDGVVIAADQAMSFGDGQQTTIVHKACKIDIISERVIVAGTGQVGLGQRWHDTVRAAYAGTAKLKDTRVSPFSDSATQTDLYRRLCALGLQDFVSTNVQTSQFGALVAYGDKNGPSLCEFAVKDFQPELKSPKAWFVSMGSGQRLADAYLALVRDAFWDGKQPTLEQAEFAAVWVMKRSIDASVGGVALPINIAVIAPDEKRHFAAHMLDEDRLDEHLEAVEQSIKYFGAFKPKTSDADSVPEMPEPPVSVPPS